jgi:hypothetical protein
VTDKELLTLAVKADLWGRSDMLDNPDYMRGYLSSWNPLEDDKEAFRLAVRLRIVTTNPPNNMRGYIRASGAVWDNEINICKVAADERITNDDPYNATRRAIVRVAAKIGEYYINTY